MSSSDEKDVFEERRGEEERSDSSPLLSSS
jgi:hypothetical protein